SDNSTKINAFNAMKDLILNVKSTHIIVSYNDEGIIPIDDLIELLKENSINNTIDIVKIDYQKYNSKIKSKKNGVTEYLLYINKKPVVNESADKRYLAKKSTKWEP